MMDCLQVEPLAGCWAKADGSFESVAIHYEYGAAVNGRPIVVATRYTRADGGDVVSIPATDTVNVGPCTSVQVVETGCISGVASVDLTNVDRCELVGAEVDGVVYTFTLPSAWTPAQLIQAINTAAGVPVLANNAGQIVTANGVAVAALTLLCVTTVFEEDFGTGGANNARTQVSARPGASTTYTFVPAGNVLNGEYAITSFNDTGLAGFNNRLDTLTADGSGAPTGNALIVNAALGPGEFYRLLVPGLTPGRTYGVRYKVISTNISPTANSPSIQLQIIENGVTVASQVSGSISNTLSTWTTPPPAAYIATATQAVFTLINNGAGGAGNDLAIDDIEFFEVRRTNLLMQAAGPYTPVEIIKVVDRGGAINTLRVFSADGTQEYVLPLAPNLALSTGACPVPRLDSVPALDYAQTAWCVAGAPAVREVAWKDGTPALVWRRADNNVFTPTTAQVLAATPGACPTAGAQLDQTHVVVSGVNTSVPAGLKTVTINNLTGVTTINGAFALGDARRVDSVSFNATELSEARGLLPAFTLAGGTWQWVGLQPIVEV
jgi:hypothetical protein